MSGTKRVTIDTGVYDKLRSDSARLTQVRTDLPRLLDAAHASALSQSQELIRPLQTRQEHLAQTVAGLSSDLHSLGQSLYDSLDQQHRELVSLIDEEAYQRASDIQSLRDNFEEALEQERNERRQEIGELASRVSSLELGHHRRTEVARELISDVRRLFGFVNEELPHQAFAPNQLARLRVRIEEAEASLRRNMPEASFVRGQETLRALVELVGEVTLKQHQWLTLHSLASRWSAELEAKLQAAAHITVEGEGFRKTEVDVDQWSNGLLSELRTRLRDLKTQLGQNFDGLALDKLQSLIERDLPAFEDSLSYADAEASKNILRSQTRYEIAALLAEEFEQQLYEVVESGYIQDDERDAYGVKLADNAGSEVTVVVHPAEEGVRVEIVSFDTPPTTDTLRVQRAAEVRKSIEERTASLGVRVGSLQTVSEAPDPSRKHLSTIPASLKVQGK